ncbi:MAG: MFS transporter [Planctomycetota bacterium]
MSPIRRLYLSALLMDTAFFGGWAAIPFLVRHHESGLFLDDGELGLLRGAAALTYVIGTIFLSPLWIKRNHALVARSGALIVGLCFVLASVATEPWMLYMALSTSGLALSLYWPNLMSLVGTAPGRTLVERIGSFNCWWSTGKAVAFLAAAFLLDELEWPALTIRCAGFFILAPLLLVPGASGPKQAPPELAPAEIRGREEFFRAALIAIFACWFLAGVWENQFPEGLGRARLGEAFGIGYPFWANMLLFSMNLGLALGFYALRCWRSWPAMASTIAAAALLLVLCQAIALWTHSAAGIACCLFLMGACFAVLYGQSLYHAQAGQQAKVRRSGIHEGVLWIGQLLGPTLGGLLVELSGRLEAAFELNLLVVTLCLLGVLYVLRAGARQRRSR